ncbi:MAG: hypothetical protein K8I00_05595 [Candidatus Omnitrophica bacterium]|nr:hypothetical protein [Candidatus Omnitrophota bacterium]
MARRLNTLVYERGGALLLEVLLAIVIMSVSLGAIIQAMTTSLRGAQFAAQYTRATIAADNKMLSAIKENHIPAMDMGLDAVQPESSYFHFSVDREDSPENSELEIVGVSTEWDAGRKTHRLKLYSYMRKAAP